MYSPYIYGAGKFDLTFWNNLLSNKIFIFMYAPVQEVLNSDLYLREI